jgi:predicted DsbA family dithiol-disulfide isomerase
MAEIELDVWSDIVCPWCYMGKRRLEAAIMAFERPGDVTVTFHAFELDPNAVAGTGERMVDVLARRYQTDVPGARSMMERAAVAGRPDGIVMDLDNQRTANTFDAHRMVALGLALGGPALQAAVVERLFAAVFAEGKAVDDHAVLQRLGAEAGLDERRLAAVLSGDEFAGQVRSDEETAQEIGISGVPFTVAGQRIAMSGAQPMEGFLELLNAAAAPAPR